MVAMARHSSWLSIFVSVGALLVLVVNLSLLRRMHSRDEVHAHPLEHAWFGARYQTLYVVSP